MTNKANKANRLILDVLPTKQGISPSRLFLPTLDNQSVAKFTYNNTCSNQKSDNRPIITVFDHLKKAFCHIDECQLKKRFDDKLIFVQQNNIFISLDSDDLYQDYCNHHVYYYRFLDNETVVPFDYQVVYENDRLLVVDKPHFLTISPAGHYVSQTLLTRLKNDYHHSDITPIHRLDRETAGLVLFCKDKKYRSAYQSLFDPTKHPHKIQKIYHAIADFVALDFPMNIQLNMVRGEPFYTMQVIDGKPNTQTLIDILQIDHHKGLAKYQLQPITGKLHQLRVHLNHLKIPIKNDRIYPIINHQKDDFNNPLQLLAKELSFIDPIDNKHYVFVSERELYFDE